MYSCLNAFIFTQIPLVYTFSSDLKMNDKMAFTAGFCCFKFTRFIGNLMQVSQPILTEFNLPWKFQ